MEENDEFGDLYADVGVNFSDNAPSLPFSTCRPTYGEHNGDGEEQGLYGVPSKDTVSDELLLYGQVSENKSINKNKNDILENEVAENEKDRYSDGKGSEHTETSPLNDCAAKPELNDLVEENGGSPRAVTTLQQNVGKKMSGDFFESGGNGVLCGSGKELGDSPDKGIGAMPGQITNIPGLSSGAFVSGYEEVGEGNGENWGGTPVQSGQVPGDREDWDSDSDDDLQIVLNDDRPAGFSNIHRGGEGGTEFEDGSDNEDGDDDLVIVTGGDQPMKDQEWGEETQLPLEGAVSASGGIGEDRHMVKGNIGMLNSRGASHSYHPHYSQFKYVRPGAVPVSGAVPSSAGLAENQTRSHVFNGGVGGPGRIGSVVGKGDWSAGGGRGNLQRTSHSGVGVPLWSSGPMSRIQNGFEFTLPPNKTIYDINVDKLEEKRWRHPGVDITDFFNFDLDEDSWKHYCKQLEQLRLEATMQSKIRVYESGRSEQEYDPDLPPELAAATGMREASGESIQHRQPDTGSSAVTNLGRGLTRARAQVPTGRAIQVEGGIGERLPSVDVRRPRLRDSDAVIQIVLQDATEDDSVDPTKETERVDDTSGKEKCEKGGHETEGNQRGIHVCYSSRELQPADGWERETVHRKTSSGGGIGPRSITDGDGILPLPPGPPIMHQQVSNAQPGTCPTVLVGLPLVGRQSELTAPYKDLPQVEDELSNGSIVNREVRGIVDDSCEKGRGMIDKRKRAQDISHTQMEKNRTSEIRCMRDADKHLDEMHFEMRSDDHGRFTSDMMIQINDEDEDGSVQSVKRQKLRSQKGLPATVANYGHLFNASRSDNSKSESGNSRDYSKDLEDGEQEWSIHRQQKKLRSLAERKRPQFEEETHIQPKKEYLWNSEHVDDRDIVPLKGRENLYHHKGKEEACLHRNREEMQYRKAKEGFDKHKERGDNIRCGQGRDGDIQIQRERDDDVRRSDRLEKEDGLKHRNRGQHTERCEREEHMHMRRRKDDDDDNRKDSLDKEEVIKRRGTEGYFTGQQENEDDPYPRRKKEENLRARGKADKAEGLRDQRERADIGRDKLDREGLHFRRKAEEYRRDRFDNRTRKHRDDMWRRKEREDEHWRMPGFEETYCRREREDKRSMLRGSSKHRSEGKLCYVNDRDESHAREEARVMSIDKNDLNEKKRHEEQRAKARDRLDQGRSRHHERDDICCHDDRLEYEQRSSRHDRTLARYNMLENGEEQKLYREKHNLGALQGREFEGNDRNGSTSGLIDSKLRNEQTSRGRRKSEDYIHQDEKVSTRGMEIQEMGRIWGRSDHRTRKQANPTEISERMHEQEESYCDVGKLEKGAANDHLSDDECSKRGRSNSERWAHHKAKLWNKGTSKHQKDIINYKEGTIKMEEPTNTDQTMLAETKRKLGKDGQHLREEVQCMNYEGKGLYSDEPVNTTDSKKVNIDQNVNQQHLETVAKLEKRRERFKQPICSEKPVNKKVQYETALQKETDEVKPERPARKRRWASS